MSNNKEILSSHGWKKGDRCIQQIIDYPELGIKRVVQKRPRHNNQVIKDTDGLGRSRTISETLFIAILPRSIYSVSWMDNGLSYAFELTTFSSPTRRTASIDINRRGTWCNVSFNGDGRAKEVSINEKPDVDYDTYLEEYFKKTMWEQIGELGGLYGLKGKGVFQPEVYLIENPNEARMYQGDFEEHDQAKALDKVRQWNPHLITSIEGFFRGLLTVGLEKRGVQLEKEEQAKFFEQFIIYLTNSNLQLLGRNQLKTIS